ncbi:MAG TPA: thiamine biosynthesis protein ThiS [Ruminococcus sp.]|nr:thiamine biosynthesis protein ThiS [Ruminococcus sp.]
MVRINGAEQDAAGKTIAQLIEEGGYKPERVAVELNFEIVPKSAYTDTTVKDGDSVEIVGFVGGG